MCLSIPGQIKSIQGNAPFRTADVKIGATVKKNISLVFVPDAKEGDYILVHAGNALQIVNETEAKNILDILYENKSEGEEEWQ